MLSTSELNLLEPLDAAAPQATHMFYELRKLGYKAAIGWTVRPLADGDGRTFMIGQEFRSSRRRIG